MSKVFFTPKEPKNHKRIPFDELNKRLYYEINQVQDLRSRVMIVHLYIEYWINEILRLHFFNASKLIDDSAFTFEYKLKVLDAFGVFEKDEKSKQLRKNIEAIQNIRNRYSHLLLAPNETNESIRGFIKNLRAFYTDEKEFKGKTNHERCITIGLETITVLRVHYLLILNNLKQKRLVATEN